MIRNDNAQGEYYITDMVRLLAGVRDSQGAARYRLRAIAADHPQWVQSFNSPDELLAIQDYVRQKRLARRESLIGKRLAEDQPPAKERLHDPRFKVPVLEIVDV